VLTAPDIASDICLSSSVRRRIPSRPRRLTLHTKRNMLVFSRVSAHAAAVDLGTDAVWAVIRLVLLAADVEISAMLRTAVETVMIIVVVVVIFITMSPMAPLISHRAIANVCFSRDVCCDMLRF
jgi:hypothetical protein